MRRRKADNLPFFGCSGFPGCRNIVNLTPAQEALLASNPGYGESQPKAPFDGTRHDPSSPNELDNEDGYTAGSPFDGEDDLPF
jgi:hypothetical protein